MDSSLITKALIIFFVFLFLLTLPPSSGAEARGIRTNNPGNLIKTPIKWQGKDTIGCKDKVNECFVSAEYGIRAMVKTLRTYYIRDQVRSIDGIVSSFGPRGEQYKKERESYSNFLRHRVPIVCGESYRSFLYKLVPAIIHFENGKQPYKLDIIKGIIDKNVSSSYVMKHCDVELDSSSPLNSKPDLPKEEGSLFYLPIFRERMWI